jgi:hypothetical protein
VKSAERAACSLIPERKELHCKAIRHATFSAQIALFPEDGGALVKKLILSPMLGLLFKSQMFSERDNDLLKTTHHNAEETIHLSILLATSVGSISPGV